MVKCKEKRAKDMALMNTSMKSWRGRTTRVDRDKLRTIQKIRREERKCWTGYAKSWGKSLNKDTMVNDAKAAKRSNEMNEWNSNEWKNEIFDTPIERDKVTEKTAYD